MRAHALARPHPSRRAYARSNLPNAFGMRAPQDKDEHRGLHSSPCQTAHLVPAARFPRPRFATLLRSPRMRVGGAPRVVRVLGGTPVGVPSARHKTRVNALMTRHARRLRGALRPMTRDARLSARHRGVFSPGAALPSPAFAPDRLQRAPRSQVVVPGGRLPGPPGASGYKPPPQDATPRSAFRIVSRTRPQ